METKTENRVGGKFLLWGAVVAVLAFCGAAAFYISFTEIGDKPLVAIQAVYGIRDLAFSPDGTQLSAVHPNSFITWNAQNGRQITAVRGKFSDSNSSAQPIKISQDGRWCIGYFSNDRLGAPRLEIREVRTGKVSMSKVLARRATTDWNPYVGFSPRGDRFWCRLWDDISQMNNRRVATIEGNRATKKGASVVWRVAKDWSMSEPVFWPGLERLVEAVHPADDGNEIASQRFDLVDAVSGAVLMPLDMQVKNQFSGQYALGCDFSPNGKYLAGQMKSNTGGYSFGGEDGSLRLWDVQSQRLLWKLAATLERHVTKVSFSPDGEILAVGGEQTMRYVPSKGWLNVYQTKTGKLLQSYSEETGQDRWQQKIQQTRSRLLGYASPALSRKLGGWPMTTPGDNGPVTALTWSPDGKSFAAAYRDSAVKIWPSPH